MDIDEMAAKAFRVSSFTAVGHLLHINLKDHLLQHKHQIGEALLKNNPRALAVVNKVSIIDNAYRNFEIEVIAKREGCNKSDEELMIVDVNENKCRYTLDFSKVYWNSRLSTEHERIIAKLNKSHDIVFDLFAGVGPFSVPAAKAKCKTYANDLNPESIKWLKINMKRNKILQSNYQIFNMDAKDFILEKLKPILIEEYTRVEKEEMATKPRIHILMNLPALAPTFLSLFIGLLEDGPTESKINSCKLVEKFREQSLDHIIYCYCFLKGVHDDPKAEVRKLIEDNLGRPLADNQLIDIFRVRNVAVYKDMYRVDIKLDENLLFGHKPAASIMKGSNNRNSLANGSPKRVTIQAPNGKRARDDSSDSIEQVTNEDGGSVKRARALDYCNVI